MYVSILGGPIDKDLERYPAVHHTGPHEWVVEFRNLLP